ncbi:MAG TPA: alpha/beta hydrolase [Firmicutes bacterium]|nr:alpha/beta hydrolase [Bacillota bacterium]
MKENKLFLTMDDQEEIYVRLWEDVKNPRAILQLAHGMAEHIERYCRFAAACNKEGVICFGGDHRGHGKTGEKSGSPGYFAPKEGFERAVDDLYQLNLWQRNRHPNLPIFLLGHSMGSFLARRYLQKYGDSIDGAILMGSSGNPGFAAVLGKLIARLQMRKDPSAPSPLLDAIVFRGYNKGIKNPRTKFDWLSTDPQEVDLYEQDPHCGQVFSSGFFYDLFTGLQRIHSDALIEKIPKELPLLILSGEADPVGGQGRGIREFAAQYERHGIKDLEVILYPGMRHELLNEIGKEKVTADILAWLKAKTP